MTNDTNDTTTEDEQFDPSDYKSLWDARQAAETTEEAQAAQDYFNRQAASIPFNTNHNLNESADKIRLKTQVKRGEGTRDQDTHDIKVRGETPAEAAENLSETLAELAERDVFKE